MLLRLFSVLTVLITLVTPVAAQSAAPTTPGFSEAQKQEIRAIVKEYLVSNPAVLADAIKALDAHQKKEQQAQQASYIHSNASRFVTAGVTPVFGNPNGDVTIIEFSDYNCGYCRAIRPSLQQLLKDDPGLRLVVREFPILSQESVFAAKAALAANMQGKYAAFHDDLMENGSIEDDDMILDAARSVGLDTAKLRADMESPAVMTEIRATRALARDLDIHGTPALIIGDRIFPGAIDLAEMKQAIKQARDSRSSSVSPISAKP